jgi:site-specific DNA recombinase
MKVIIYPRVSSKVQLKGDSIEAQKERLTRFCKEKNYDVVDIYTDAGKSASVTDDKLEIKYNNGKFLVGINISKRPAFERLVREANSKKFDAVVFYRWDRFSRNSMFSKIAQVYFQRYDIQLIPTDDSIDPLMVGIKNELGEEEIRKMKERVRRTRLLRFGEGMMVGRMPVGYSLKNRKITLDKKKSDMVKEIFRLTLEGIDYKEICKTFKIKPQQYYNIIKNKVYMGTITFEEQEKKGNHEALVTEETFNKVQTFMKK